MPLRKGLIAVLFMTCLWGRVDAQYQHIESHGVSLHYREFGEGAPVLIVGGGPGDHSDRYLSLCRLLSDNMRCILVDQRGTGRSKPAVLDSSTVSLDLTVEDFETLRKALKLKQWTVLGFSYGGYLAAFYAHNFPASVKRLILLNGMGLNTDAFGHFRDNIFAGMETSDHLKYAFWSDSARVSQNLHHAITEQIRAMMPGYFYDREKSLLVRELIKDEDFSFELGPYLWPDIERNDLASQPCRYTGPVLILQGRQDPLGEGVALKLHDYYKDSEMHFIEKCGHYSWIEQPEVVREKIRIFTEIHRN